jgi:hypothetical protein
VKRIISVSLGSSSRDHKAEVEFLGEQVLIERKGTDGSMNQAVALLKSLDGQVDVFGMGGIDLYLVAAGKRYTIRDALRMVNAVSKTPIVDGSGLKNTLERRVVQQLQRMNIILHGKKILMVSAVDRFGMAEAMTDAQCRMLFGDLIFALGLPIPIHSIKTLRKVAKALLPFIIRMPFSLIYPTGKKQETVNPKYQKYYEQADVIAGDFLFIRKYMPDRLDGKIILTNTVTPKDMEELSRRKAEMLITTTPNIQGRSFGTNVMEALLVAYSGKSPQELHDQDYLELLDKLDFKPHVVRF